MTIMIHFVSAQDNYHNDEVKTIFSKRKSNGGYGAFTVGYTQIDGKDALISGVRGAFIFDHAFAIGLGGYGFVNDLDYQSYNHPDREPYHSLVGGYGGIFIEPIVWGKQPVHLSFPILFGAGGVGLLNNYSWDWTKHYGHNYNDDFFWVIEPAVELEFNLSRYFRLAFAASYRYTSDIDMYQTDENVLNGFNFCTTFKFGKF